MKHSTQNYTHTINTPHRMKIQLYKVVISSIRQKQKIFKHAVPKKYAIPTEAVAK
jgi:hypothetical protein